MNEKVETNDNTDMKADRTEELPAGGTAGEDHVFEVYRRIGMPVMMLICTAVAMLIWAAFAMLVGSSLGAVFVVPMLLFLIVLPFVPGTIVYCEFRDEVIPTCRNVCTETEIVSGAMKSLRFLWERFFLCLLPGIALAAGLIVHFAQLDSKPFNELGGSISFCLFVILLGEFPLAVFPVARMFSWRVGMIVMLILIIMGQIVLMLHVLFGAFGFIFFGVNHNAAVHDFHAFTGCWSFICITLYAFAFGYFLYAAYTDAEQDGLLY